MIPRLLPLLLAVVAATSGAAEADLEHAERLRDEARALRAEADDALRRAEPACYERFLVNRCIAKAKEQRLDKIRNARTIEAEASRLELAEKQRQAALRGTMPPPARSSGEPAPLPVAPAPAAPAPAAPSADPQVAPDPAADATRRERDAQAARDAATARDRQREQDAEKARERSKAEAEAAKRAEDAARDRARYDERIRTREQEKEKEKAGN